MRKTGVALFLLSVGALLRAAPVTSDVVATGIAVTTANFMQTGIALDDSNNVHMVFYASATQTLKYAKLANGTTVWAVSDITTTELVAPACALALEDGRIPHVVYYQTSGTPALKHAELSGTVWISDTVETFTGTNTFVSIAVGSDRNPRIAYYNSVSSDTVFASLSGAVWSTFTVVTSAFGGPVDLALSSANSARIAFVSGSTVTSIRTLSYALQSGSTFTVRNPFAIGTDTTTVGAVSLALDSGDAAHIAVYDGGQDLLGYIALTSTGGVAFSFVLDAAPLAGIFNDIAVDSQDNPRVLYFSSGVGLRLATSTLNGVSWSSSTLEAGSFNGVGPSLIVNRFDHFLAGYFNGDTSELKFITDAARDLSVSGAVLDFAAAPIPGVSLTLAGNIASAAVSVSTLTGGYSADHLFEGNYSLTPAKEGLAFVPTSRSYVGSNFLQTNLIAQNFQGGPVNFSTVGNLFDPTQGQQVTLNFSVLPGHVVIRVYTLQGRPVRTLVDEDKAAGSYSVTWDGRTSDGDVVASGVYLVRFESEPLRLIKKVVVVK